MLLPHVIQISLQERGEVITDRRVRLSEPEATRIYNLLEALLLRESGAVEVEGLMDWRAGATDTERITNEVLDRHPLHDLLETFARATGAACDQCGTPIQPGYHRCHECENKHGYHPAETGTR
jgi:hypothetical protein